MPPYRERRGGPENPVGLPGYGWQMAPSTELLGDPLTQLTGAQRDAVEATDSRLAVLAGAGAGKTRVLTLRVARMVDEGVDPSHIMVVTFSRKAAQELRQRLWRLGVEGIRSGTFHRSALELVEIHRAERGLGPPTLLTDRRGALTRLIAPSAPTSRQRATATGVDTEITWAKSLGISPADYEAAALGAGRKPPISLGSVAALWADYETAKRRRGSMDFDDLIVDAVELLNDPRFASAIHWRSRHLLVDEFQDVNPMQFALVERLVTPSSTFFCVGDPNQSIYAFNGADPRLLGTVAERFAGTRTITLDVNHRSSPEIVRAASAVLDPACRRATSSTQSPDAIPEIVELVDDQAEAEFTAVRARSLHGPGRHWRSIAVLARTNAQLDLIARAFETAGIPTDQLAGDLTRASDVVLPASEPRRPQAAGTIPDAVALGTFHRAKGLEWPHVIVIGATDGFIPHAAASDPLALDEERRLLYVAMTRAERDLTVTWAARRSADEMARIPERQRSPFLSPVAAEIENMLTEQRPGMPARGAARASSLRAQLQRIKSAKMQAEEDRDG